VLNTQDNHEEKEFGNFKEGEHKFCEPPILLKKMPPKKLITGKWKD
jgi:hypothetical protein